MKTGIVYASKYGCTADCAAYLKDKLSSDVALVDINTATQPLSLDQFDTILIGGSVYVGKVAKKLRAFCTDNLEALLQKKIGLFLCCALLDQAEEVFTSNFPPELLKHAKSKEIFGSEARLDKMRFLDKKLLNAVTKGDYSKFKIAYENIHRFAEAFK